MRDVCQIISNMPPLVTQQTTSSLLRQLKHVCHRQGFLFMGGHCAETFDTTPEQLKATINTITQTVQQLQDASSPSTSLSPIVAVARLAGQYAKPRSDLTETINGVTLPSYRGDIINSAHFSVSSRYHDPKRMLRAYQHTSRTLPAICKASTRSNPLYTTHEALLLPYEEALTRYNDTENRFYASSANMLWLGTHSSLLLIVIIVCVAGERTRDISGAHAEYLSGISNPIGVKISQHSNPHDVAALAAKLNPNDTPGKLTLITRMGPHHLRQHLPSLASALSSKVIWCCDPMHGNTVKLPNGYKTRYLESICSEIDVFFDIIEASGAYPGGVHVEMTGENVTECVGAGVGVEDVHVRFTSTCDPRLNPVQMREVAQLIADRRRKYRIS